MRKLQAKLSFDTGKDADMTVCDVRKMQEGWKSWDAGRGIRPVLEEFIDLFLPVDVESVMFLPFLCFTGGLLPLAAQEEEGLWLSGLVFGGSLVCGCSWRQHLLCGHLCDCHWWCYLSVSVCLCLSVCTETGFQKLAGRVLGQRFWSQCSFITSLCNEFS